MNTFTLFAALVLAVAGIDERSATSLVDREKIIEGILAKGSPDSAWAAYYAGKLRIEESVPALLELVDRQNRRERGPVAPVKKAALDALIRLDADVPPELLRVGLHKSYLAETLILLARDPDRNRDALFELMDRDPVEGQHWWVAAGVLAPLEPPGLAKRLLPEVSFSLSVTVRDPGSEQTKRSIRGFSSGGRWRSTSALFPPKPTYVFTATPEKGAVVLQPEQIVIYYHRTEGARGGISAGTVGPGQRSRHALRFLLTMVGDQENGLPRENDFCFVTDWVDEQDYRDKVAAEIERIRSSFERLVETLRERDLLAPAECEDLRPEIKLKVFDVREIKTPALPEIPAAE